MRRVFTIILLTAVLGTGCIKKDSPVISDSIKESRISTPTSIVKPEPTKPEPTKPEQTKPEPTNSEPTKPEPTKSTPSTPVPTKPNQATPTETINPTAPPTTEVINIEPTVVIPENETIFSISPNGKYRAEAYGTITTVTAGGLYPFEGIRVVDVDNNDVIWDMQPGYYMVIFSWSADGRYVGIYFMARTEGDSIVFDTENKKIIALPFITEVSSYYGDKYKPQEYRPDPYFAISGWEDTETVIVDFKWTTQDGEEFSGQYTNNLRESKVYYK